MARNKKPKIYKCRYAHCKHESKDVVESEAVKDGEKAAYYHKDCLEEKKTIQEIVSLFLDKVNPTTPLPQLRKVVSDLVVKKSIDSSFLLFGLQYYINHKKLNYPGGLYYVVNDKDVKREWEKHKKSGFKRETATAFMIEDVDEEIATVSSYKKRNTGFSSVLGG